MMRMVYIAVGAGIGIVAFRRASKAAKKWTPTGVAAQAGGIGQSLAGIWADVRTFSAEREVELRAALGIGPEDA